MAKFFAFDHVVEVAPENESAYEAAGWSLVDEPEKNSESKPPEDAKK